MLLLWLVSLYAAIGVTYLLGRRVWLWYHKRNYVRILKEAKATPPLEIVEVVEQSAIILPYEKDFIESESVEEREYRIEQDYYTKTGRVREES